MKVYGFVKQGLPVLAMEASGKGKELKRIRGTVFDEKNGIAYFPGFYPFVKEVYGDIIKIWPNVEFTETAKSIMLQQKEQWDLYHKGILPNEFASKTKMYAHQKDSFFHCLANLRAALFLACGLGKTLCIIELLRYLKEPALILLPPSLINNWRNEIKTHSFPGEFIVDSLDDLDKKKKLSKKIEANLFLVGYETASRYAKEIYEMYDYNIIVADESQKIKSHKANRTKTALLLASKAYRRIILSGTAVTNAPTDLFPQMNFLTSALVGDDYYKFCKQHVTYAPHNKKIVTGYKNLDMLNKRVNMVALRYKKEDCLDLPDRLEINRKFQLSPEQMDMYYELLNDETLFLDEGAVVKEHKVVILGKLAQVTGGFLNVGQKDPGICDKCEYMIHCVDEGINPYTKKCKVVQKAPPPKTIVFQNNSKMDSCQSLVEEITAEETNKIIIWCRHIWELEAVGKMLSSINIKFISLPDDSSKVIEYVDKFNEDPEAKVLLAQIARGSGWTANSANYVIYYSIDFNLENYLQSVDRNYRINQKRSVTVYRLVAEHRDLVMIDQHTVDALDSKIDIQETLLSKVECLRCLQSKTCQEDGTQPWDPGCFVSARKKKKIISI